MKILVISLLRLGDLIMQAHAIRELTSNSTNKVDLLVHPFFKKVSFLFEGVNQVYYFERDLCQRSIGEEVYNKSWAQNHIQGLVDEINRSDYDQIFDFTQTIHSTWWLTALRGNEKWGAIFQDGQRKLASHCRELQDLHFKKGHSKHFVDVFKKALISDSFDRKENPMGTGTPLRRGEGIDPLVRFEKGRQKKILLQTLTSDQKKNWPFESWRTLVRSLMLHYPESKIVILCSESERQLLETEFSQFFKQIELLCCDLREAFEQLHQSSLLITLDTAIKHLATWTAIPIIELALGSSRPDETGSYSEGSLILSPTTPCYPCRHRSECPHPRPLCHDDIKPDTVFAAVRYFLDNETSTVASVSNLRIVQHHSTGEWNSVNLNI